MNRLTKLLSLVALFSFGIATENTEDTVVEKSAVLEQSSSQDVPESQDIEPIDVEKIKKARIAKGKAEKIRATQILHNHKNPAPLNAENPNLERYAEQKKFEQHMKNSSREGGIFKRFGDTVREKYQTITIRSKDGKRGLKFPDNNEAN
tara:strand:- start:117 stop:563 length:447 start_codon:yes stop_codon:yes gene_type:complete